MRALRRSRSCSPFQCSSASRKFLNRMFRTSCVKSRRVSVLFSEPKIPQSQRRAGGCGTDAEFQCSSASRKFLNSAWRSTSRRCAQRFQCSSASRKFLNRRERVAFRRSVRRVSVLFSEPKIPQYANSSTSTVLALGFSALQRAENSSIIRNLDRARSGVRFQCSSASRKFLNTPHSSFSHICTTNVSVLFSEPKIPQSRWASSAHSPRRGFSALQRAENSSIPPYSRWRRTQEGVSVLFSEPKIPQSRPSHLRPSIFPTAMITLRHS